MFSKFSIMYKNEWKFCLKREKIEQKLSVEKRKVEYSGVGGQWLVREMVFKVCSEDQQHRPYLVTIQKNKLLDLTPDLLNHKLSWEKSSIHRSTSFPETLMYIHVLREQERQAMNTQAQGREEARQRKTSSPRQDYQNRTSVSPRTFIN